MTARDVLRHYWGVVGGRWWHLGLPAGLIVVAGVLEFASYSLLKPVADAAAAGSFDAALDGSRWFGWLLSLVPAALTDPAERSAFLVVVVIGLVILGRVLKLVVDYVSKVYVVVRNERYRVRIGQETFGRVLRFGRQYFDQHAVGRIDAEIGWSSSVLQLLVAAEGLLRNGVGLLAKAAAMVAISLPLSVAFVVSLPFVSWFMKVVNREVERIARQGVEVDRRLRSRVLDILGSMPLVKAYSQEGPAAAAYADVLREAEVLAVRRDRVVALRYPVEEVAILLTMLVVQAAVIATTRRDWVGELLSFGIFLLILQQALRDYRYLSEFSLKVSQEIPRLEAVGGLFTDEGKYVVPSGDRAFEGVRESIEIDGLTFRYQGGTDALRDVRATIPADGVTAIVGPTGAGKTTLVDLVARFYDCPPGTLRIDGVDVREFSLPSLHERMAIVSQDVWLLNRTLRENLTFGLSRPASDDELLDALASVDLADFAAGLPAGLGTEIGDRGVQLSGGQRQRVALARALLRDPDLLILDEATSALDSVVEQRVARAIMEQSAGRTLIVIAHRLSTVRDADRILVMREGRVVEQGRWDELVALGGLFTELHEAQFGGW